MRLLALTCLLLLTPATLATNYQAKTAFAFAAARRSCSCTDGGTCNCKKASCTCGGGCTCGANKDCKEVTKTALTTCPCTKGGPCICGKGACACKVCPCPASVGCRKEAKAKSCPCSDQCTCGCNDGEDCTCNQSTTAVGYRSARPLVMAPGRPWPTAGPQRRAMPQFYRRGGYSPYQGGYRMTRSAYRPAMPSMPSMGGGMSGGMGGGGMSGGGSGGC